LPFVALDFPIAEPDVPGLWVDDAAGARLAASHLAGLGHRDFAVLALPPAEAAVGPVPVERLLGSVYSGPRDRIRGYFEVLAKAGVDTKQVPIFETDNDETTTASGMEYLFADGRRPTAILAMSDRMALAAIDWLAKRGIRVPDEVSITGFDGVPEGARSIPPLTTIAQPMLEMGRRAARMILDPKQEKTREVIPLQLLVRGSTARPA
jgi:DNA-binding LacI/PurR family transcriptional regulator